MVSSEALTLFLASPNDVLDERQAVGRVVEQLNILLGTRTHVRIIKWETDVAPNVGSDPQAIVNAQLGDSYDIFLGIFWGRLGTPTPRAQSGTVEEIERALVKHAAEPNSVAVMIYFKEEDIPFNQIDVSQFAGVQQLRKSLQDKSVWKPFKNTAAFERMLLVDLHRTIQRLLDGEHRTQSNSEPQRRELTLPGLSNSEAEDLALGYIDLLDLHDEQMAEATATLGLIGQSMDVLTEENLKLQAQIASAASRKDSKTIFDTVGSHLAKFANDLRTSTSNLSKQQRRGYSALIRAIVIGHEDGLMRPDETATMLKSTSNLVESYRSSMKSIEGLRTSIENLPRYTTKLALGRDEAVRALSSMLAEQENGLGVLSSIQDRLSAKDS